MDVMHEQSAQVMAGNAYVFYLFSSSTFPRPPTCRRLSYFSCSISIQTRLTNLTTCHCVVHTLLQCNSQHPQRHRYLCSPSSHSQDRCIMDRRPHCHSGLARLLVSLSFSFHSPVSFLPSHLFGLLDRFLGGRRPLPTTTSFLARRSLSFMGPRPRFIFSFISPITLNVPELTGCRPITLL